jgi:hypothetical protein
MSKGHQPDDCPPPTNSTREDDCASAAGGRTEAPAAASRILADNWRREMSERGNAVLMLKAPPHRPTAWSVLRNKECDRVVLT